MSIEVRNSHEYHPRNRGYLQTSLERRAWEATEDKKRWAKDHPGRQPGDSGRTWKSFSRQRYGASELYLRNYQRINWSKS